MSDRPMRLKYLTKMKIILCIFLLCITAVSVFGQSVELNGIVGERIEFPTEVETSGSLKNSSKQFIERIVNRVPLITPEYQGRVQWDSSTGLFSLSGLRLNDSGVYTVENTGGQSSVSTFNLTVWKDNVPVSKPRVSVTHDEFPCTLLCTAERGTGVTLSWYREGEEKPYGPVRSAPDLYLPQTVARSGTYTCEAKNSVSNEKASITVEAHCTDRIIWILTAIVVILLVTIVAYFLLHRFYRKQLSLLRDFICCPKARKTMTSSHQTGVPLNKATSCEVEEK